MILDLRNTRNKREKEKRIGRNERVFQLGNVYAQLHDKRVLYFSSPEWPGVYT